jgi:ABC-type transporter lipoprotein component MlaA
VKKVSGTPDWREIKPVKQMYKQIADRLVEQTVVEIAYNILTDKDYLKQMLSDEQLSEYEFDTLRIYLIAYLMRKYVK